MFKKILKDERGLSLVELLAVVVIMAIIAGIGALAISNVIQNTKEDAAVANVQQMMNAANLYQMSVPQNKAITGTYVKTIEDIRKEGFITHYNFIEGATDLIRAPKVTFRVAQDAVTGVTSLQMHVDAEAFTAGPKKSIELVDYTESKVGQLTRDLFLVETP